MATVAARGSTADPTVRPAAAPTPAPPEPGDGLYRLTVEQYEQMGRAGILGEDEPVELIEGLLVKKMPRYARHVATTKFLFASISRVLPEGWHAAKEDPIALAASEPEPDVSVLRGGIADYLNGTPRAGDLALVVEVADSSYADDLQKRSLYAEAGIPHYWIANLNAERIEAYADPTGPDPTPEYRSRTDYPRGETIPLFIAGREVARLAVSDLLAPPPNPEA